jgi:adenylate kinase family enzyme/phosphopantetheine adenylyltransferase
MKILIMGLPGAGKTTLAEKLADLIKAKWLNADKVRKEVKDWDFSEEGRTRQAKRMSGLAEEYKKQGHHVVADFVCPTPEARKSFNSDFIVWVNTIEEGRFADTNIMFVNPKKYDVEVTSKDAELWAIQIADKIIEYKWDNKKPTAQMLGRWQPFHDGHYNLFEKIIKKTGQVCIQVRDVKGVDDNPFDFESIKSKITAKLDSKYKNRFKVVMVPNITNICYGRGVGYKIEEIVLSEEIQKISATKIRKEMRKKGNLK